MKNLIFYFLLFVSFGLNAQVFENPGFENITCSSTCDPADNSMDCVPGWFLNSSISTAAPLMRTSCNETVCEGNFAIQLVGTSGPGVGVWTNNPFFNMPSNNLPLVIGMDVNVDPISDIGTGVGIAGWDGTTWESLGFAAPDVMDQCVPLAIPVSANIVDFPELRFYTSLVTGHLDIHKTVIDNVTTCGSLFEISEECGMITVETNPDCIINPEYAILEVIKDGDDIFFDYIPANFTVDENGIYEFNIYYDLGAGFQWLVIDYEVTTADELCCDGTLICSEETDLDACATEDNFGFIHISCNAATDLSFNWSFPSGSTASEFTCDNHSILTAVSEGDYSVTITDQSGCEEVRTYEVKQDCCDEPCQVPSKLDCKRDGGKMFFTWEPVPGAVGYEVYITKNDPDCCNSGPGQSLIPIFTSTNVFGLSSTLINSCFSWRVRTVCKNNQKSAYSPKLCYSQLECYKPIKVEFETGINASQEDLKPSMFPNPSNGDVTFQFKAPSELKLGLDILSTSGKLMFSISEKVYYDGVFEERWNSNGVLEPGLYYVSFNTNFGKFQEKLIIVD